MKRVYESEVYPVGYLYAGDNSLLEVISHRVYKLSEELSDLVWCDLDKRNKKIQNTIGYQIIRASDSIAAQQKDMDSILLQTGEGFTACATYIQRIV